ITAVGVPIGVLAGMLMIWWTGWFWTVYNSLVGLKNRVKMATANIDVELKRRFDLLPQLVRIVEGMRNHEQHVQETVAVLRNQALIDSVSESFSRETIGCVKRLVAIVENYPELKSDELFMKLHDNLVSTEQRIALARNYYNDVIETYNNRCERFPESFIASIAMMKRIAPFQAEGFERAAIEVELVGQ
ncbi:MAG: LemA family protein, partial [Thermoguttaceae bacterium]